MLNKNESFEMALMQECEVLYQLLLNSEDKDQQDAIKEMLVSIVKHLNHKGGRK